MHEEKNPIQAFASRMFVAFGPFILLALYSSTTSEGFGILALCVGVAVLNAYTAGVRDLMEASKNRREPMLIVALSLAVPVLIWLSGYELTQIKFVIDSFFSTN